MRSGLKLCGGRRGSHFFLSEYIPVIFNRFSCGVAMRDVLTRLLYSLLALFVALLTLVPVCAAQPLQFVFVDAKDPGLNPIQDLWVSLRGDVGNPFGEYWSLTDSFGRATFYDVPEGLYIARLEPSSSPDVPGIFQDSEFNFTAVHNKYEGINP